ncbi:hypothetical protein ABFA07_014560 [Porites harrisoni]
MNLRGFLIAVVLVWATIQESVSFSAGIGNLGLNGKKRAFNQNWKNQVLKTRRNLELLCRYIEARSDMTHKRSGATTPWHIREICEL